MRIAAVRAITLILLLAAALPASAGTKEQLIQLQTSMDNLQAQIQRMQQSFDERMGVMKNLIDQTTDNINRMNTNVDTLSKTMQQQQQQTGQQSDQISAQIQQMHDSVDELKARIAKVSKQLEDFQAQQQNLQAAPAGTQPAGTTGTTGPGSSSLGSTPGSGTFPPAPAGAANTTASAAPPPDVLYNNALRDYNSAKLDLATQEFGDYLRFYPTTDLAGNAQYYLADILYRNGDYAGAVKAYDRVLEQYPGGNKAAAAQLTKGFALLELGQKGAGTRELRALTIRYPKSIEAQQAKDRLRRLGAAPSASSTASRRRTR